MDEANGKEDSLNHSINSEITAQIDSNCNVVGSSSFQSDEGKY